MKRELTDLSLFSAVIDTDNIWDAYQKTQRGSNQHKIPAIMFREQLHINLKELEDELRTGTYSPSEYNKFYVHHPKKRLIFAPSFRDKIVQHAINNILRPIYERKFIFDSYACLVDKGNHAAVKRLQNFAYRANKMYDEPYVVKLDISKFFYSIDRDILKEILLKDIPHSPDLIRILFAIIDSSPETGLPLGNLSSQLLANIVMNVIDQYVKNVLKIKFYIRYADDMFIIVKDKEIASTLKHLMVKVIPNKLNLVCHPKKSGIYPLSGGIVGLGFIVFHNKILINQETKRTIGKLKRHIELDIEKGTLNKKYRESQINSLMSFISASNNPSYIINVLTKSPNIEFFNNKLNVVCT